MSALPPAPLSHLASGPAPDLTRELEVASRLARQAGALLLDWQARGVQAEHKTGADDLVTQADRDASALIVSGLQAAFPEDGLLSEEETDSPERLTRARVWLIDPIDGTSHYAAGRPGYAVSIGLALGGEAVLGVVYAPVTDELFVGVGPPATLGIQTGVSKNGEPMPPPPARPPVVAVSETEYRRELQACGLPGMHPSGSIALKLARIAAGEADATFCMSPRSEWDLCAGHALLRAAGGELRRRDGRPIRYNALRPHLEQGVIGGFPAALEWLQAELLARRLPSAYLGVGEGDPAWKALAPADQRALAGHPGVCLRAAGPELLALIVVGEGGAVERAGGDAFHLERLTRDLRRAGVGA